MIRFTDEKEARQFYKDIDNCPPNGTEKHCKNEDIDGCEECFIMIMKSKGYLK